MDYIQIQIENDIYEYLKSKSTFEDTPSSVLRRELRLPLAAAQVANDQDGARDRGLVVDASGPPPTNSAPPSAKAPPRKNKAKRTRAAAGTLLPESEYHRPLLEILREHGGSAPKQIVIDALGERLADRLTEADHDELDSGGIRWQSRTQFARLRLADRGFIDKNAPRGTWAITEEGTKSLEEGSV